MTVWRLRIIGDGRSDDVALEADPATPLTTLAETLTHSGYSTRNLTVANHRPSSGRTMAELQVAHGDLIDLDGTNPTVWPGPGTYLVVVAGPDTAKWTAIEPGRPITVGRSGTCDLVLRDALLSGRHLDVVLGDGGELTVTDLDSSNGTWVEGVELVEPATVEPSEFIRVGTSILTVLRVGSEDLASVSPVEEGSAAFQRRFREADPPPNLEMRSPRPPSESSLGFQMSWLRALAPLFAGLGFALITGNYLFLIIMAISPLIFILDNARRRRRGAREQEEAESAFSDELQAFDAEVAVRKRALLLRERALASPGGMAAVFGLVRHRRLWERSSSDPDFGSITVGLAEETCPIKVQGDLPDDHRLDLAMWAHPMTHSLLREGSLAVVGPVERARAVARSMVMELSTAHSPGDLNLWVLTTDEAADDWNCMRWLPHAFIDEYSSRVAARPDTRSALVTELQRTIANRLDAANNREQAHLPMHVVVIDGAAVVPSADLTEILERGRSVGVVGITIDEQVVPEGTRGLVKVGAYADTAAFSSNSRPQTLDVVTFEVTAPQADLVNRRLAGLRPVTATSAAGGGTVRLCDLNDTNELTVASALQRWGRGPNPRTVVGVDGETPISVDVMRDGPHGLVGGTTRSGKTEFLKSLLMGLCLENHPDDLSIAIIDFKGGVDHEAVAQLPHVIDLSTNTNIESFERTTALLNAELIRRQEHFRQAGAPNLDAYRSARASNPALTPIPRLLVVVDEFGELLASDTGKESLGQLESITRIGGGLGVHLLLVTQNFENQLPPQIAANAGMRICFRVQQASHSKIVLDSDAAATIPASRIGRAYLRFHGGEVQEFQSARVAGPRPGVADAAVSTRVIQIPFATVASATPPTSIVDVPVEQTDLWHIVETLRAAARESGWTGPVVPWTSPLPPRIELAELLASEREDRAGARSAWVIGLADHPDEQRHQPLVLDGIGTLTLAMGNASSGLAEVLSALVISGALARPSSELNVYVIDQLGQGLAGLAELPHCGSVATRNDVLSRRIIQHISDELARRKAAMLAHGAATLSELRSSTGETYPDTLLIVHGADRVLMHGEGAVSPLYSPLVALTSELGGSGVAVLLSGMPAVAHNRLGSSATRRLVFALPSKEDYGGLEVDRVLARAIDRPGRGFDSQTGRLFHAATVASEDYSLRDLCISLSEGMGRLDPNLVPAPAVRDVPWPLPWSQVPREEPPRGFLSPLANAVSVDSGDRAWFDGEDDGPVLAVTGSPKSGRSTALLALGRAAKERGWRVIGVPLSRRSPLWEAPETCVDTVVDRDAVGAIVDATEPTVVLIDDLHRWEGPADVLSKLLAERGRLVLAASGSTDFFDMRSDSIRALGTIRAALVLAPSSGRDASPFGVARLSEEALNDSRSGRGVMVLSGEVTPVQVPMPTDGTTGVV